MKNRLSHNGPVVIGGIGGSGTRVVAEILSLFGFFMGRDLNKALDNLTFTLLFKRPAWYLKNADNKKKLLTGLRIMEKAMVTATPLTLPEKLFLRNAVHGMSKHGHNREKQGTGDWPYQRSAFIKNAEKLNTARYKGWGWKEPNSHLLVPVLSEHFPDLRYIHTVRHGLDMAYSSNQQQLFNWGPLFGVKIPESEFEAPSASFRYWVEANRRIMSLREQLGHDKILVVNFDRLCEDPRCGIREIADFLQLSPGEDVLLKAAELPVTPKTTGRWKQHPEDVFDEDDLVFLRTMGFNI